jgi:hypothetical protein
MAQPLPTLVETPQVPVPARNEASSSGVSWAAIASGASVTAALFLALSALGAGVGLSTLSPWSNAGASPSNVGFGALLWLTAAEILACAIGGYVAGRLRTKWVDVHSDEVYFRDTAHGFLVWAVAFVATAAFLASASTALVGGENRNANAARSETTLVDANRYFIDSLFRSPLAPSPSTPAPSMSDEALRSEIGLIFAHSLRERELSESDLSYVADTVAARTGIPRPEAEQRVADTFTRAQHATDTARKAVAHSLYWLFVALLLGAFAASLASTFGGKQRDHAHVARI